MRRFPAPRVVFALFAASLAVSGCSSWGGKTETLAEADKRDMYRFGSVLGNDGGLSIFGNNGRRDRNEDQAGGLGVNGFLWRASLDTLSFMPIVSADPFGGVILTDWYSPPEAPSERFKVNLYIMDRQLRADGVRVAVFKQQRAGNEWREAGVGTETASKLEDAVLTRARQLRVAQASLEQ